MSDFPSTLLLFAVHIHSIYTYTYASCNGTIQWILVFFSHQTKFHFIHNIFFCSNRIYAIWLQFIYFSFQTNIRVLRQYDCGKKWSFGSVFLRNKQKEQENISNWTNLVLFEFGMLHPGNIFTMWNICEANVKSILIEIFLLKIQKMHNAVKNTCQNQKFGTWTWMKINHAIFLLSTGNEYFPHKHTHALHTAIDSNLSQFI